MFKYGHRILRSRHEGQKKETQKKKLGAKSTAGQEFRLEQRRGNSHGIKTEKCRADGEGPAARRDVSKNRL